MRRKRVAQHVWMHARRDALLLRPPPYTILDCARTQSPALLVDEQRILVQARNRCALRKPGPQRFGGMAAHRHDARLAALARNPHRCIGKIDVLRGQSGQFGQPQPRGIKQFEHRPVAHCKLVSRVDFNQLPRFIR